MPLEVEQIDHGQGRQHSAYATWPTGVTEHLPAVIVVQELWGVDPHTRPSYSVDASRDAFVRPLELLRRELAP